MLRLNLMNIFVENPHQALLFYTNKLGFVKRTIHESINYVTVGAENSDVELILETNENTIAKNYQRGLYKQGVPAASFYTENLDEEYARLITLGVEFTTKPIERFGIRLAIFDDQQGNLIQIVEAKV